MIISEKSRLALCLSLAFFSIASAAQCLTPIYAQGARNVVSYGADPTGQKDSTRAFLDVLRRAKPVPGSDPDPIAIYVPSGTYLLSRTIILPWRTHLLGDPNDRPTLLLKPNSVAFATGSSPFIATYRGANESPTNWSTGNKENDAFWCYISDINIKIGEGNPGCRWALLWATAQESSIRNVSIDAGGAAYGLQSGYAGGGGGVISDVTISNTGNGGFYVDASTETVMRDCTLNCPVILTESASGWIFLNCTFNSPDRGFTIGSTAGGYVRAMGLLNSRFVNGTKINVVGGRFHLENIQFDSLGVVPGFLAPYADSTGKVTQFSTDTRPVPAVYYNNGAETAGTDPDLVRRIYPHPYLTNVMMPVPGPQCINITKRFGPYVGAIGDGKTDNTTAIQYALAHYQQIFFPEGTYKVAGPLEIRPGCSLFGHGAGISNIVLTESNRRYHKGSSTPFVTVSGNGVRGVTIVGLQFSNFAAGGICLRWNGDPSSIVMDSQFLQAGTSEADCIDIQTGGGFFENGWCPGAFSGCGMNISSNGALWLYAVQLEHYKGTPLVLNGAANIVGLNLQFEYDYTNNNQLAYSEYIRVQNSSDIYVVSASSNNYNGGKDNTPPARLLTVGADSVLNMFLLSMNFCSNLVADTTSETRFYGPSSSTMTPVYLLGYSKHR
jgi:hypothetical protein